MVHLSLQSGKRCIAHLISSSMGPVRAPRLGVTLVWIIRKCKSLRRIRSIFVKFPNRLWAWAIVGLATSRGSALISSTAEAGNMTISASFRTNLNALDFD